MLVFQIPTSALLVAAIVNTRKIHERMLTAPSKDIHVQAMEILARVVKLTPKTGSMLGKVPLSKTVLSRVPVLESVPLGVARILLVIDWATDNIRSGTLAELYNASIVSELHLGTRSGPAWKVPRKIWRKDERPYVAVCDTTKHVSLSAEISHRLLGQSMKELMSPSVMISVVPGGSLTTVWFKENPFRTIVEMFLKAVARLALPRGSIPQHTGT